MEHQWTPDMRHFCSVFFLLITAVSVSSAQPVELNLRVGDTVTFTTEVRSNGGLTYSGSTIGDVSGGRFTPLPSEQYRGRVQWDSSTGLFSITGLKMEDSGRYRVKNDANLDTVYQLTVFTNVSSPLLTLTHDKYPCTLLCTVDRGTQVTLSLYREGEGERYVNYPPVNAPHHLPQTVDRSGTYTCEAKNSVSKKMTSITVGDHCTEGSTGPNAGLIAGLVLLVLACVGVLVGVIAYLYRYQSKSIKDQKNDTQANLKKQREEQNERIAGLEKSKKELEKSLGAEIRKQREEQTKLAQDLEKSKKELETILGAEIRKQREEQTKLAQEQNRRIADLEKSKNELERSLGALKESENALTAKVEEQKKIIEAQKTDTDALKKGIADQKRNIDGQNQRIQALVQSKTNLEKSLGALEKSKNALTERIAGLEKSKKEQEKSPRALKESENALTAKVEGKQ